MINVVYTNATLLRPEFGRKREPLGFYLEAPNLIGARTNR